MLSHAEILRIAKEGNHHQCSKCRTWLDEPNSNICVYCLCDRLCYWCVLIENHQCPEAHLANDRRATVES